jgi:hypothetical protein
MPFKLKSLWHQSLGNYKLHNYPLGHRVFPQKGRPQPSFEVNGSEQLGPRSYIYNWSSITLKNSSVIYTHVLHNNMKIKRKPTKNNIAKTIKIKPFIAKYTILINITFHKHEPVEGILTTTYIMQVQDMRHAV